MQQAVDIDAVKESIRDCVFRHKMETSEIVETVFNKYDGKYDERWTKSRVRRIFEIMNKVNDF